MTEHKLIVSDQLIGALMKQGIVDNHTRKITIIAEVGSPIVLEIEKFGDDRLLEITDNGFVMLANSKGEAVVR